jgi:hypothetical protein
LLVLVVLVLVLLLHATIPWRLLVLGQSAMWG